MKNLLIALAGIVVVGIIIAGVYIVTPHPELQELTDTQAPQVQDEQEGFTIETEVDGPEDCMEIEAYDAETRVCFVECDTEAECDDIEDELDTLVDNMDDEYGDFSKDFVEFEGESSPLLAKADAVYTISNGEVFTITKGTEKPVYKKIKRWLASISPDQFSNEYLSRLVIYTDSESDTAAFVEEDPRNPTIWDVYVNMDTVQDGDKEMVFTLIHEYAHIMTLNIDQVDPDIYEYDCDRYHTGEGCADTNAYINQFYQKYWKGKKFDPLAEDSIDNYYKDTTAFVTEYAATNPGEDIAESFASFVFKKQSTPHSVAEQKVQFFYAYPELVKMRDNVRTMLKGVVRGRLRS
jgi:hypothetical protein